MCYRIVSVITSAKQVVLYVIQSFNFLCLYGIITNRLIVVEEKRDFQEFVFHELVVKVSCFSQIFTSNSSVMLRN